MARNDTNANNIYVVEVVRDTTGAYSCSMNYPTLKDIVNAGAPVMGIYHSYYKTGTEVAGGQTAIIQAFVVNETTGKICMRGYFNNAFSSSNHTVSGSVSALYMAENGAISTSAT